jgi:hypothetical protein
LTALISNEQCTVTQRNSKGRKSLLVTAMLLRALAQENKSHAVHRT